MRIINKALTRIPDSYYILLTLFNCSFLLSLGAGYWKYQKTTAFIIVMIALQFLSRRFWFTTFLSFIPFYCIKLPLFPRLTNHGNLQIFIGILLLICIISALRKNHSIISKPPVIQNLFIYPLVTVYVLAGIHKLNSDFFDLNFSCTNYVSFKLNNFLFGDGFEPSSLVTRISQILTIFFELIVPIGLLFQKTRKASVWFMVVFHAGMSVFGFSNFSALAGFLLCGCIIDFNGDRMYYDVIIKGLKRYIAIAIVSVVVSYMITRFSILNAQHVRVYNGLIFNIGWFAFFAILISKTKVKKQTRRLNVLSATLVIFIIFWGGQSYLGLSNAGNLTMFSNLKTEKSRSNHYVFNTNTTKIWSFEEDLVTMLSIPKELKWQGSIPLDSLCQLPLIEFKSQANVWIEKFDYPLELTIKYKGDIIHIKNLKNSKWSEVEWWYHYIYFRKITQAGTNQCLW